MRAAVVGVGNIGKVHARILRERGLLAAVCDPDEKKLAEYPDAETYTDFYELLERGKPQVVHLCTPHDLHAEMIVAALDAGINVLCEKPLCIRRDEVAQILRAEARSDAILGVCLQNRFTPAAEFVRRLLTGKRILGASATVAWHRDAAYYRSDEWRGTRRREGGGALINQALHTLDLLEWFVGMPERICATLSNLTLRGEIEVEDTASVLCSGGAEFCLFASNGSPCDMPVTISVRTGSENILMLPDNVLINGKPVDLAKATPYYGKECYGGGHSALIGRFYECVERGERFPVDAAEGAKSVRLVLAAYESKGEWIKV